MFFELCSYKTPQEFEEVEVEPLVKESLSDTTELWLIQMPLSQFEPADFQGKELSIKLPEAEGWMGSLENSCGKSYDMYCLGNQGMEPFSFLPRSSTSMGVRKISCQICLLNAKTENGNASGRADISVGCVSKTQDRIKREGISQDPGRSVGSVGQKSSHAVSGITSEGEEPSTKKRGKFSKEEGVNGTLTASRLRNLEESGAYDSSLQQGQSYKTNEVRVEYSTGMKKKKPGMDVPYILAITLHRASMLIVMHNEYYRSEDTDEMTLILLH
ncbi:uncharacterized protein LOC131030583 isoform X2 [Cryptomeria japonica]|uniref:uncharacterized protein LOC131030583 isoform X2 n=1 Tax=Cryptomeria japonica TaxID=3369 RepID=UPI0027DA7F50|nr:uncharacterized protein LOC131030583 isoform X2 [Cryptomeria japonica]